MLMTILAICNRCCRPRGPRGLRSCLRNRQLNRFWMTEFADDSKNETIAVFAADYPPTERGEVASDCPNRSQQT